MKQYLIFIFLSLFVITYSFGQSRAGDIPVKQLPNDVKAVLEEYISILRTSADLEECAQKFVSVAGGSLVNENGTLRNTVKPYSLKKDFNDVRHYADPIKITRVNVRTTSGDGYGATALKGKVYKVWVDKKSSDLGMPAPISIIVPEGHPEINTPKIIGIGSL